MQIRSFCEDLSTCILLMKTNPLWATLNSQHKPSLCQQTYDLIRAYFFSLRLVGRSSILFPVHSGSYLVNVGPITEQTSHSQDEQTSRKILPATAQVSTHTGPLPAPTSFSQAQGPPQPNPWSVGLLLCRTAQPLGSVIPLKGPFDVLLVSDL